jgi:DNA-binding PadR family transcriptional regulator
MESPLLLDRAILAVLARHGPATGRGVAGRVGVRGPVHLVLRRLEREELVSSRPLRGSIRRAHLYRITAGGAETLGALQLWSTRPSWANSHKVGPDAGGGRP